MTYQENEIFTVWGVEELQHVSPLVGLGHAVQPEKAVALEVEVVLDDGHALRHLTEHENSVAGLLELGQDAVEELELAGGSVDVGALNHVRRRVDVLGVGLLDVLEHEGMVAELSQLHDRVHEGLGSAGLTLALGVARVGQHDTALLHVGVQPPLKAGHLALDNVFDLVGQLRLDVLLEPPEQEGSEHFVETTDDQNRFFLVQLHLLAGDGEGSVEPLLERVARLEDGRQQEVEQGPQLGQLVLERGLKNDIPCESTSNL